MVTAKPATTALDYERITRRVRWMVLGVILVTLPLHQPQTLIMLGLVGLGCLFNLTRYHWLLTQSRWYASRATVLVADNLLVAALLVVVGRVDLPYSALLGMIVITATYWYGIRGTFGVISWQLLVLGSLAAFGTSSPFPPLMIDPVRSLVLALSLLIVYGLLLEQLTSAERQRRDKLETLERDRLTFENRLFALVNSLSDAIATVDSKGNITIANTAMGEFSGQEQDLRGVPISKVLSLKHAFKQDLNWTEALHAAPIKHRDYFLKRDDGTQINVELTITPTERTSNSSMEYIVSCHDITQDKSLDKQRQEFVAVASHELRTPLAFIEGALTLATAPTSSLEPQTRSFLEQAHRNVVFLSGLIDDLTLLTKAQNDNIEVQPQAIDPSKVVNRLVEDYISQAQAKQLMLRAEVKPGVPSVLTTERYVEQIMRNLVSNAIKYTKKGEVTVRAEAAKHGGVLFSVQDMGAGLSQADQKHLFTEFFRAENFQTRETGGIGLGLYICQEVAQRINAKLWVNSKLGHGSTFYLEVPPFSNLSRDQGKVVSAGVDNLVEQL